MRNFMRNMMRIKMIIIIRIVTKIMMGRLTLVRVWALSPAGC